MVTLKKSYFKGWYIKQTSGSDTLALIPAFHTDNKKTTASLQVITNTNSYYIDLGNISILKHSDKPFFVNINGLIFNQKGVNIDVKNNTLKIKTHIDFDTFNSLKHNIMGPFAFVPFMQCRHGVISMCHRVNGYAFVNDVKYEFNNSKGYIETDSGKSFPDVYFWTQANSNNNNFSVMLSVAKIPFLFWNFNGCICIILHNGKQYLLATYKGAKVIEYNAYKAIIKQGDMMFYAQLINGSAKPLKAPVNGAMQRTIKESADCTVRYILIEKEKEIFNYTLNNAGFEYSDCMQS